MAFPVLIEGSDGYAATVTHHGELVVAPASPNVVVHHSMTSTDTAYNFAAPIAGKKMRLQNILIYANKTVANTDATIIIYTANAADTTTVSEIVLEIELPKYASRDLIGLNLELPAGVYLNAKTDDATVFLTMMGYYIDD